MRYSRRHHRKSNCAYALRRFSRIGAELAAARIIQAKYQKRLSQELGNAYAMMTCRNIFCSVQNNLLDTTFTSRHPRSNCFYDVHIANIFAKMPLHDELYGCFKKKIRWRRYGNITKSAIGNRQLKWTRKDKLSCLFIIITSRAPCDCTLRQNSHVRASPKLQDYATTD